MLGRVSGKAFIFGYGFVGAAFAQALIARGWAVAATSRRPEQRAELEAAGVLPVDPDSRAEMDAAVRDAAAILITAPPGEAGCPGMAAIAPALGRTGAYPDWIGYLSTTGVYGDRGGRWVDETSPRAAISPQGARRVAAERDWRQMGRGMGLTVTTFRLPGIYGPGRSAFDRLREGKARRIHVPGHVFSRAHRDDIVSALIASISRPRAAGIYNICDDEPAPGDVVIEYAAKLLGMEPPPLTDTIPEKSRRFYAENKRVANALAKGELGWRPMYPSYREGLEATLKAEG